MRTTTITKQQLDKIVEAFCNESINDEGKIFINIDEDGLYVDGVAQVYGHSYDNYVTIDGVRYKEGTYYETDGISDLYIDAWQGDDKIEGIDTDYLKSEILANLC